jgi:hypothetical protein
MSELVCRFCGRSQGEHLRWGNNFLCPPQLGTATTYPHLPQFVENPGVIRENQPELMDWSIDWSKSTSEWLDERRKRYERELQQRERDKRP